MKKILAALLCLIAALLPADAQPKKPVAAAARGQITQKQALANPIVVLQRFTLDDVNAALADAKAQTPPDQVAINCYTALASTLQSPVINPLPSGLGAFQALQKARDAKNNLAQLQANGGPLEALKIGCAAYVVDAANVLSLLGLAAGAIAPIGGVLPIPIPGLPPLP
jgi:hypothetical protein